MRDKRGHIRVSEPPARDREALEGAIRSLGHELRSGLAAINLWGSILRSRDLSPAEHARAVDAILSSNVSLGQQIDQLLELARSAGGLGREHVAGEQPQPASKPR